MKKISEDVEKKIIEKPWDDSIKRSVLLNLMNTQFMYLLAEFHKEITEENFDRIFGKDSNLSHDMVVFVEGNGKEEIVGFTGVSDISGTSSSWRLFTILLPEYYETHLPKQIIEAGISLGKKHQIKELTTYTHGPLDAPFVQAFENLEVHLHFYLYEMHLTEFKNEYSPKIPPGVAIRRLKDIDDYEQFIHIHNEAFRPISGFEPTTIEKMKNIHEFRKTQREVDLLFAYEAGHFIGYLIIEYNPKTTIGYGRSLAVHPKHQHRGIGRYLAMEGIKRLQSKKCKRIELQVVVSNENALSLYQDLGFHSIEKLKRNCYKVKTSGKKTDRDITLSSN